MKQISKAVSFILLSFALAGFNLSHAQLVKEQTRTQVAAGAYHTSGSPLPLLLVSNNQGQSWSFVQHISGLPSDNYTAMISSTSCNESICSAVGSGFTQTPLLISRDKGQSWSLVNNITGLPQCFLQNLSSISCTSTGCVAAGIYSVKGASQPLLITSDANGQVWSFVNNIKDLPSDMESAELASVNCMGHICVAVGRYEEKKTLQPLLLVSSDGGQSWSCKKTISGISSDFKAFDLKTVNCSENACIAAGKYNNGKADLPLLLVSKDNANSWSVIRKVIGLPSDLSDGTYSSISCSKNSCIVVGMYHTKTTYLPLLIRSDNGKDWSIVHNIVNLPVDLIGAEISSVSCTQSFCVAAGYYAIDSVTSPFLPLLLISNNCGHSWIFVKTIQDFPQQSAIFNAISCSENSCTAAGEYHHISDISMPPPLVVSTDRGATWQFIQNISSFPSNLKSAEVFTLTDSLSSQPDASSSAKVKNFFKDSFNRNKL